MSTALDPGARPGHSMSQTSPIRSYPPMQPPYRNSPRDGPVNPPVSLPPLRQLSKTPPTPSDRRLGNPFGVHSMLNPEAELGEHAGRRRSASQMESSSPVDLHHSQSLPPISRPTSVDSTQEERNTHTSFHPPSRPSMRHILSPKSPKLHRTQSHGLLNAPTGTIDAHQSPFLTANTRPSEPMTLQPALPTPPVGGRPSYFPAMPPTAPTPPPNMVRKAEIRRPSISFPQSGSASPITQYSPYSQAASVASSQYESQNSQTHSGHMHVSRHGSIPMETERNSMISMAPSSQSSIQLMTIKSHHGHPVQIPVDVQAASKVADEKRRRNAGASARFRARRKEKEREASMSINRLEQQVRDAVEDAEYYRRERDYFKAIVFQQPHPERHYARPPSPRLRRISVAPSLGPSSTDGLGSDGSYGDYDDEEAYEEERNVRRRTSNYQPPSGPAPAAAAQAGSVSASAHAAQGQSASPVPHYAPQQQGHQSGPHQSPSERPSYRDQFAAEPGCFDDRRWASAQSQSR